MVDLRAAEARNTAVLNAIPDLLFELDIDGLCSDYRAPHTNLLAAPADTLVGRTVRDVLPATAADIGKDRLAGTVCNFWQFSSQWPIPAADNLWQAMVAGVAGCSENPRHNHRRRYP